MDKPKFTIPPNLTFMDACLQGLASTDNLEDYVEYWHTHPEATVELHDFLGLTAFEYGKLLTCNDSILDDMLYCRQHGKDLAAAWTSEQSDKLQFLLSEIPRVKDCLIDYQTVLSEDEIQGMAGRLGGLMEQKNQITGWDQDILYLYCLDKDVGCCVLGFPGDSSGTVDAAGHTLLIGDVVSYAAEDGKRWNRMVLQCANGTPALEQDWLLKHDAKRVTSYTEAMQRSMAFTGIRMELYSCRADAVLQRRADEAAARNIPQLLSFPVYWRTPQEAWNLGEQKLYRASEEANSRCAESINGGTHESMYYPLRKTLAQELVQTYGMERSQYVLASYFPAHYGDGRLAREVEQWSKSFLDEETPWSWNVLCTANPGVMSMLAKDLMKLEQRADQAISEALAAIAPAAMPQEQQTLIRNNAWDEALLRQTVEALVQSQQEPAHPSQEGMTLGC